MQAELNGFILLKINKPLHALTFHPSSHGNTVFYHSPRAVNAIKNAAKQQHLCHALSQTGQ
jgi:hypothetical protein